MRRSIYGVEALGSATPNDAPLNDQLDTAILLPPLCRVVRRDRTRFAEPDNIDDGQGDVLLHKVRKDGLRTLLRES